MIIFTIALAILAIFAVLGFNFALYKSVEELYDGFPKWLHILLLIPPFSLVAIILISIGSILYAIYNTIKYL